MTKEEWKKIADWWGTGLSSIEMNIDGHEISLLNTIDKKRMIVHVVLYVNGYYKGEYTNKENEIGNRFYQRVKNPLYSSKELKDRIKAFGKRDKMAQQVYHEYNNYYWRSFNAFKRHITNHNTDVRLVTTNTFESDGTEA